MHPRNKLDTLAHLPDALVAQLQAEARTTADLRAQRQALGINSVQIYDQTRIFHAPPSLEMATITDLTCPGPHGDFPARLIHPQDPTGPLRPLLVFCHGGGFVVGSMASHDSTLRRLAHHSGCPVLAFDYHLAPGHRHPTPMDECQALLEWILPQADALGFSNQGIALAGDSAGATIALATFLRLRDQASPLKDAISALLLYYGYFGLQGSMSAKLYGGWWDGMTEDDLAHYLYTYHPETPITDPELNLFEADLSWGLPKTYLLACGLDPLLDDSRTLAAVFSHHQIPHQLHILNHAIHACLYYAHILPDVDQAMAASLHYWLQEDPYAS